MTLLGHAARGMNVCLSWTTLHLHCLPLSHNSLGVRVGRMQTLAVTTEAEKARLVFPASFVTRVETCDLGMATSWPWHGHLMSLDMDSEKQGQVTAAQALPGRGGSAGVRAYGAASASLLIGTPWVADVPWALVLTTQIPFVPLRL